MNSKNELKRGAYVMANDAIEHMLAHFLETFRMYNPQLPILIIPFDTSVSRIKALAAHYNAEIYDAELEQFNDIGRRFRSSRHGPSMFRKFSVFQGPFDEFVFYDADITVLSSAKLLFQEFSELDVDLLFGSTALHRNYQGALLTDFSKRLGLSPTGYNNALFVGRRNTHCVDILKSIRPRVREKIIGEANEQALLSYVTLVSGLKAATLNKDSDLVYASNANGIQSKDTVFTQNGSHVIAIHWGTADWGSEGHDRIADNLGCSLRSPAGQDSASSDTAKLSAEAKRYRSSLDEAADVIAAFRKVCRQFDDTDKESFSTLASMSNLSLDVLEECVHIGLKNRRYQLSFDILDLALDRFREELDTKLPARRKQQLFHSKARALNGLRRFDEAVFFARESWTFLPSRVPYLREYIISLYMTERYSEAARVLDDCVCLMPENRDIIMLRMSVSRARGDTSLFARDFEFLSGQDSDWNYRDELLAKCSPGAPKWSKTRVFSRIWWIFKGRRNLQVTKNHATGG